MTAELRALICDPGSLHSTFPALRRIQDLLCKEDVGSKAERDGKVVGPCGLQGKEKPSPLSVRGLLQAKIESFLQHSHCLLLDSWWSAGRQWGIGRPGN